MTDSDQRSAVESTKAPHGDRSPRARAVAPSSASIGPINRIMIPPHKKLPSARRNAPMALPTKPLNVRTFGCNPDRAIRLAIGSIMKLKTSLTQSVNERKGATLLAGAGMTISGRCAR